VTTEQPTGPDPDLMPTPPRGFPAPVPGPRKARVTVLIAGIVGLALGAALVGGAWLLFGNDGASSSAISAPERISGYYINGDAPVFDEDDRGRELADRQRDWDSRSSERLSTAYDGAGALVRTYSDEDAESRFVLEAVRAPSPAPYAIYSDPEVLGLDRPIEEVREYGEVSCTFNNTNPGFSVVIGCQRTDEDLTVRITRIGGDELQENPERVAELVDAAWTELS
jgi:hypothetical protein